MSSWLADAGYTLVGPLPLVEWASSDWKADRWHYASKPEAGELDRIEQQALAGLAYVRHMRNRRHR